MENEMQHLWYNPTEAGSCDPAPKSLHFANQNLSRGLGYLLPQTNKLSQNLTAATCTVLPPGLL
jgi:hypothetical protein